MKILKSYSTTLIFNFSLWILIYLIKSFVIYQFTNPFQWVIDIPTYLPETRFCIIILFLTYQALSIFILNEIYKLNK